MNKNLIIIFVLIFLNSCDSHECGCTVKEDTLNYDPTLKCDDGSCIFYSYINIIPDSVAKYNVDIYIDSQYVTRLTRIVGFTGFKEKFLSTEIHHYMVKDDFGKVWQDTFRTVNKFRHEKNIYLRR